MEPVVNTNHYVFAHGKSPRGNGSWAFFMRNGHQEVGDMFWANGPYSVAKKAAVAEAKRRGVRSFVLASSCSMYGYAEGAPRDPLVVISKLTPPKNTDIGWMLLNRGADTIDYEAMVERMRSALSDGKTPGAQRVLVEKSIPTPRDARFTMNARFDPKAGPPILAAMSILAQ